MNMTQNAAARQTIASMRFLASSFARTWDAFQARRKRERLRAALFNLSEREFQDIGITRGEIDYAVSSHRCGGR